MLFGQLKRREFITLLGGVQKSGPAIKRSTLVGWQTLLPSIEARRLPEVH